MSGGQVHIQKNTGDILRSVDSYRDALRLFEVNNLGEDWQITDSRGGPTEEESLVLLAQRLRAQMRRPWQNAQFDRILDRAIPKAPKVDCDGLQLQSAASALCALNEAGFEGWSAKSGTLHRNSGPVSHAWLERDDGMILDFMSDRFGLGPVVVVLPHERNDAQYHALEDLSEDQVILPWIKGLADKIADLAPSRDAESEFEF